jgi:peptidyl-prolyl cis-trans isomerase B (cyclophilin B)
VALGMTSTNDALRRRKLVRIAFAVAIVAGILIAGSVATSEKKKSGGGTPKDKPEVACDAEVPDTHERMQFDGPEDVIQEGVDYGAIIHTSCGDITIDLLEKDAPATVNNFVFLAREGYYDGLQWFRVESNSVIETGDPNNRLFEPPDDPGYKIEEELPDEPRDYVFGAVAMANEGRPNTTGSNFFIVIHENRPAGYQAAYSIFGRAAESSTEVLLEIGKQPVKGGNVPLEAVRPSIPIYVESIEITES